MTVWDAEAHAVIFCLELIAVAGMCEITMSRPNKSEQQLVEIDYLIANYQKQLSRLQVEILKLELKKEKLRDQIILQSVKSKIVTSMATKMIE
jgi:hypothetical protein